MRSGTDDAPADGGIQLLRWRRVHISAQVVPGLRTALAQFTHCHYYAGRRATDALSTRLWMAVFRGALDVFRTQFLMAHR